MTPTTTLLNVHEVAKHHGGAPMFSGISFALAPGDRLAVLRASCSGKTTLLQLLLLDEPSSSLDPVLADELTGVAQRRKMSGF
ncbi:MAG: hypothetical protein ACKV19_25185 [Verrucomicrobiales bacterium]